MSQIKVSSTVNFRKNIDYSYLIYLFNILKPCSFTNKALVYVHCADPVGWQWKMFPSADDGERELYSISTMIIWDRRN